MLEGSAVPDCCPDCVIICLKAYNSFVHIYFFLDSFAQINQISDPMGLPSHCETESSLQLAAPVAIKENSLHGGGI